MFAVVDARRFALPAVTAAPSTTPATARPADAVHLSSAIGWGALVALAMSTQLLFQPFVWRNFELDEVFDGWIDLLAQRLSVTLSIAVAIWLASRVPRRTQRGRAALLGAAILAGALLGELALVASGSVDGPASAAAVVAHLIQWSMLSGGVALIYYWWRTAGNAALAAQAAELRRIDLEQQVVQARLRSLRSQIEPHFLFNTLATVRRLQETEPTRGAELIAHFLEYLRSTLPERASGSNTLGQEIDLVRAYLGMVSVRMEGRLVVEIDAPVELQACEFPPLTVATLVENAVKHGIAPAPAGGAIRVAARSLDGSLEVVVEDTGVGFSTSGGSGIGIANVRSRLRTLYGDAGRLMLHARSPHGVRAVMHLPLLHPAAS